MNVHGSPRVTIVSFADASYFPLLYELIVSIQQNVSRERYAISVLDAGLTDQQLKKIEPYVQCVTSPEWDLPNLPWYKKRKPVQKAFTCLPFLPRYFPGYDVYLWLDADCWVADACALDLFVQGANRGRLAICPSLDRSYTPGQFIEWVAYRPYRVRTFLYKHARRAFGRQIATEMALFPELNTGVFALHRDAPHWEVWADWMKRAARKSRIYGIDQLAVAMMIYKDQLPVELLPAWCNWLCAYSLPIVDAGSGQFLEPNLPHHPIGVVHLAGLDDARANPDATTVLRTTDDGHVARSLRYELPRRYGVAEKVSAFSSGS